MGGRTPVRVLAVNASVAGGGAERVALSLHRAYRERGVDALLAVGSRNAEEPGTFEVPRDAGRSAWARTLLARAWRLEEQSARPGDARGLASRALRVAAEPARWARVARGHEDFDFPWTGGLLELAPPRPDVLHLHNLHGGYFDIRALPALTAETPAVLTLHDTWLLTGHCAQPFECGRWREGCGGCPDLGRYVPIRRDASVENREVKRRALLGSRLGLAAPSAWLLSMAEESGLLGEGREGRVIPNGIDPAVFAPGERAAAREALGLPQDRRVVLVAAKGVRANLYKGFATLLDALERLPDEAAADLLVVALGDEGAQGGGPGAIRAHGSAGGDGRVEVRGVPFAGDPERVADYHRAADVFVHPSLADTFPLAPVEAMACGTPVLASDAGGLPEVVEHDVSGLVVPAGDAPALAEALERVLGDAELRERLSSAGVRRVAERFTLGRQADAYLAWYAQLAEERAAAGRSGVAST